jgi:hypothetical protein
MLADVREIQFVEHQTRRFELLVMASDAVLIENGPLGGQGRRSLGLSQYGYKDSDPTPAHLPFVSTTAG